MHCKCNPLIYWMIDIARLKCRPWTYSAQNVMKILSIYGDAVGMANCKLLIHVSCRFVHSYLVGLFTTSIFHILCPLPISVCNWFIYLSLDLNKINLLLICWYLSSQMNFPEQRQTDLSRLMAAQINKYILISVPSLIKLSLPLCRCSCALIGPARTAWTRPANGSREHCFYWLLELGAATQRQWVSTTFQDY